MRESRTEGVRHSLGYSKRDLLLFGRVHILGLQRKLEEASAKGQEQLVADLTYLAERGFVADGPRTFREFTELVTEKLTFSHSRNDMLLAVLMNGVAGIFGSDAMQKGLAEDKVLDEEIWNGAEIGCALALSVGGPACRPIMSAALYRRVLRMTDLALQDLEQQGVLGLPTQASSGEDLGVMSLVYRSLPTPGDEVSLEAILDFVRDKETQRYLERLQVWTRRESQSGKGAEEVRLDIDEGLQMFTEHMRLADMRHKSSGMRMLLTLPLGVIEELLHLKPKKALDVVFEYKDRKATRLEEELSAPGGALAYIYEAERRFGSKDR